MNIIQVFLMTFGTLSLICLSLYFYLIVQGNSCILCERSIYNTPLQQSIFLILAAIGFLICMFSGAETMLSWIPYELGGISSEGEFTPFRIYLASAFTLGSVAFLGLLETITPDKVALRNSRVEIAELGNFIDAYDSVERLKELRRKYLNALEGVKSEGSNMKLIDAVLDCTFLPELSVLAIYKSLIRRVEGRLVTLSQAG